MSEKPPFAIRPAGPEDRAALWAILAPVIAAGETYALDPAMPEDEALAWWLSPDHRVFVAEAEGNILGTYFLKPNQKGGGAHVANCGYMTARGAEGRGVARALCAHSLEAARQSGFAAMQFNFVVAANRRAVALWQSMGFEIVGRLPRAFRHPAEGLVDALVMYRPL